MDRLKFFYSGLVALLVICFLLPLHLTATTRRWNGSSSADWNNYLNWTPAGVPEMSDDAVLNNDFIPIDYSITLPDSTTRVNSLRIFPSGGRKIQLSIPFTNKLVPGLSLSSVSNSLILERGAIFRNSSGLSSGQSIMMGGKFLIRNGGLYIHNTRASHATGIVGKLSTEPGTEFGQFEFDVPGGAYSLSLSNRNYGTLRLRADASGGSQTYNSTGSGISNVRGNLEIESGVVCNLNLAKNLTIGGDFVQEGGVFNLASQPNNIRVNVEGSFLQKPGAVLTETSTGLPYIAFQGPVQQRVSMAGTCVNSVGFMIDNPWGIVLDADFVVPYSFVFKSGKVQSSTAALLQIGENAIVTGASDLSFVDGPVLKAGNGDFQFPIGRQGDFAPIKISAAGGSATDKCTAQYHHGNPQTILGSKLESGPLLRISSLEYWTLDRVSSAPQGKITLTVGGYSHATSLQKLVVTGWDDLKQEWTNCGNSAYSGVASGTVTSNITRASGVFTVGSTVPDQNPLPVYFEALTGSWIGDQLALNWKAHNQQIADRFLIELSGDGINYTLDGTIPADTSMALYTYRKMLGSGSAIFCRVVLFAAGTKQTSSQEILVRRGMLAATLKLYPMPAHDILHVQVISGTEGLFSFRIADLVGRIIYHENKNIQGGENLFDLPVAGLRSGVYFLRMDRPDRTLEILPFIKL